jgi:hypothetical protein
MPGKSIKKVKSAKRTVSTKASRSAAAKKAWRTRKRIYGKSGSRFGSGLQPAFQIMGPFPNSFY